MASASGIRIDDVRAALAKELEDIERLEQLGAESRKPVELDQTSVGRLSRMDALQQQALANETQRRRAARRRRIAEAFRRIEEEEFGFCENCGEPIPSKRLDLDLTVRTCVRCA